MKKTTHSKPASEQPLSPVRIHQEKLGLSTELEEKMGRGYLSDFNLIEGQVFW